MSNLSAAQAENYYETEDYYSQDAALETEPERHPARWYGKGAATLELMGTVDTQAFRDLLHGQTPQGQSLHAKRIDPAKHRAGTDFTFSAPKSVSIAALLQRDLRVLEAHDRAVETALFVLEERYAQARISTSQGRQRVTTGKVIAAIFRHQTSREQDPQLHSHCVVINATQSANGSWRSLSNEEIVAHQKLLGEIYQNELAHQLGRSGYEIETRKTGQFELRGYSPELLSLFSTRTRQIEEYLHQWERSLQQEERVALEFSQKKQATLQTRRTKAIASLTGLMQTWEQRVQQRGWVLPLPPAGNAQDIPATDSAIALQAAIAAVTAQETGLDRSQIERFVLENYLGQRSFQEWQQAIEQLQEFIPVDPSQIESQTEYPINPLPLFQVVYAQTPQTETQFLTAVLEHRDFYQRLGKCVGERLSRRIAATLDRTRDVAAADRAVDPGNAAVEGDRSAFAGGFEQQVEPVSRAIAAYLEQRELDECTTELAGAVAAVNCGFKYLEQAAQNRARFAATVNRLHAAARIEAQRFIERASARRSQQRRPSTVDYRQRWQKYSRDIVVIDLVQRDRLVAQRAFAAGLSRKEVALMLSAESPYVRKLVQDKGKGRAIAHVNQTLQETYQQKQYLERTQRWEQQGEL